MFFEMIAACFVALWLMMSFLVLVMITFTYINVYEERLGFKERPFYNLFKDVIFVIWGPVTIGALLASQ